MRLREWKNVFRDVEFDTITGKANSIALTTSRSESEPLSGFATVERSVWCQPTVFALYRDSNGIRFSAGYRSWTLNNSDLSFNHKRWLPFLSHFHVRELGRICYSFWYFNCGRLMIEALDPTYDSLDFEADYFLSFVARNAMSSEWQQRVFERWIVSKPA